VRGCAANPTPPSGAKGLASFGLLPQPQPMPSLTLSFQPDVLGCAAKFCDAIYMFSSLLAHQLKPTRSWLSREAVIRHSGSFSIIISPLI
jgi:hypothetical protein